MWALPTAGRWTRSSPAANPWIGVSAVFPLEPAEANYRGEVAKRWRYVDGGGEIGVITSITQPFCGDCTRARLSPEGELCTCLFGTKGHEFRSSSAPARPTKDRRIPRLRLAHRAATVTPRFARRTPSAFRKVEMSHIGG